MTASAAKAPRALDLRPWRGGGRLLAICAVCAIVGLGVTLVFAFTNPRQAAFSYLTAFCYWLGISLAGLIILGAFHASHARWVTVLRRPLEAMGLASAPFVALFVPVLVGMKQIFYWAAGAVLPAEQAERMKLRVWYLNVPFFLVRAAVYFLVWVVVAYLLYLWSVRQDQSRDAALTGKQRRLGAGALPALGLTFTWAAYDWMMSPAFDFYSEILGAYFFGGSLVCVLSLLVIAGHLGRGPNEFGRYLTEEHFHSLGKLMLAFVAFWAWMAFSQYMLTYVAHLPDEIGFFVIRNRTPWAMAGWTLVIGQFGIPFFALLSRKLKRRPAQLSVIAVWLLFVHYVDVYWLLMPMCHPDRPHPHLADLTAFLGVGGVAVGFAVWLLRGRFTVPVGDPYLQQSLRYLR